MKLYRKKTIINFKIYINLDKSIMKEKVQFNIKAIQTDNGLECKKYFDKYIYKIKKIIHYFKYILIVQQVMHI